MTNDVGRSVRARSAKIATVSDQIEDRAVRLVPDRADHRRLGGADRPHQALVAERQQIFQRSAPTSDDDHLDLGVGVQFGQTGHDIDCRVRALHESMPDSHLGARPAALQIAQHIAFGRAAGAGDQPDAAGQEWQLLLTDRVEQPLGLQFALQLLQLDEQPALAGDP